MLDAKEIWQAYLACFPANKHLLLEFMPDGKLETLQREAAALKEIAGMLNGKLFETMLPYATFLNTGCGAQVVEEELIAVLKARPDLTAVLDVTDPEPPVAESEFYSLPNCVLTPHIAGSSGNEVRRLGDCAQAEYEAFTTGKPCRYEVTLEMLQKMA